MQHKKAYFNFASFASALRADGGVFVSCLKHTIKSLAYMEKMNNTINKMLCCPGV